MEASVERQLSLERQAINEGVAKYRRQLHESNLSDMPPGVILLNAAIHDMSEAIKQFRQSNKGRFLNIKVMMEGISNDELAWIALKKSIDCIVNPVPATRLANEIANIVLDQIEYKKFHNLNEPLLNKIESNLHTNNSNHRHNVIFRAKRLFGIQDTVWNTDHKTQLGSKLLDLLIESTGIIQRTRGYNSQIMICGNRQIKEWVDIANKNYEVRKPLYLPMITQPMPWFCPYGGGFLSNYASLNHSLVKTTSKENLQKLESVDMPMVYKAINGLQNTKWRINKRILEVMLVLWDQGGDIAGLPAREAKELPAPIWFSDEEFKQLKQNEPGRIKAWKRQASNIYRENANIVGKRVDMFFKLKIANQFKDEPAIYFCWQMDWRGRFYPIQNFINPQKDDSGKALLEFAEGKPLGESGVRWLMIHIANAYGYDKASFDDRIQWVKDYEREILDSALHPLDGEMFWLKADDPFCFLAACFEYEGYRREGPGYRSRLPIGMDATASGLQHFSAMLRDYTGGQAVNLLPGSKPSDIYQLVANEVIKLIDRDIAAGKQLARLWKGKIDRKLVKRGTMTKAYSVTAYGMKEQILDELMKRDQINHKYLDADDYLLPAIYLGEKLEEAIGKVVVSANLARDWFKQVARVFNEAGLAIEWVTPSGFLCRQEYRKNFKKRVVTYWGSIMINLITVNQSKFINTRKQTSGISPNFIHSMDGSLMAIVIERCLNSGIDSFQMIHDCFGCHAADLDAMNQIIREAFVTMYSSNILTNFRNQVIQQLPPHLHSKIPPVPAMGTLDITEVMKSDYFCN